MGANGRGSSDFLKLRYGVQSSSNPPSTEIQWLITPAFTAVSARFPPHSPHSAQREVSPRGLACERREPTDGSFTVSCAAARAADRPPRRAGPRKPTAGTERRTTRSQQPLRLASVAATRRRRGGGRRAAAARIWAPWLRSGAARALCVCYYSRLHSSVVHQTKILT